MRVVRDREDRPKGFGYVEFQSKEALLAALDMNGLQLAGRTARVNVAEPRKSAGVKSPGLGGSLADVDGL